MALRAPERPRQISGRPDMFSSPKKEAPKRLRRLAVGLAVLAAVGFLGAEVAGAIDVIPGIGYTPTPTPTCDISELQTIYIQGPDGTKLPASACVAGGQIFPGK